MPLPVPDRRWRRAIGAALLLALLLVLLPAVAGRAEDSASLDSAVIPLLDRPGDSGFANFIAVSAGGGPVGGVLLDTGSTGLRIRAEALGPQVQLTDTPLTYSFTSGNVLTGVLGYMLVSFPGARPEVATAAPIAVHVVKSITCKPEVPRCPGWAPQQMGVMGVAYSAFPVFNPLAQLPGNLSSGFIVVADDMADPTVQAHLVVGLTAQNSAGFKRIGFPPAQGAQPAGLKAWNTKSVPTCFSVDGGPEGCSATVFDTGAGSGSFLTPDLAPALLHSPVPRGARVRTRVEGVMDLTVKAGRRLWADRYRYAPPHGSVKGFNSGGLVFRHYKVLFDAVRGEIGFKQGP